MKNFSLNIISALFITSTAFAMQTPDEKPIREEIKKTVDSIYEQDGCGICHRRGAEVFWYSSYSKCAHRNCYNYIAPATKRFCDAVDTLAKSRPEEPELKSLLNVAGNDAVQQEINRNGMISIKEYADKNGLHKLQQLYEGKAILAVMRYLNQAE